MTALPVPNLVVVGGSARHQRRKNLPAFGAAILLVLGVAAVAAALTVGLRSSADITSNEDEIPAPVMVAERPVNGRIAFTIPLGAADAQFNGGAPYQMPPVIRLQTGDAVVVTNDDVYPHMILNALAKPGETTTITFDSPGAQAFSSGCTANGGTMNSFTSVIVSARE